MRHVNLLVKVRKHCDSCDKYNYLDAKFCSYCGDEITDKKVYFISWLESPDLLQSKKKSSNHPNMGQNHLV